MKYIIEIRCNTTAFGDSDYEASVEVVSILEELSEKIKSDHNLIRFSPLKDNNGNRVGSASFVTDYEVRGNEY